MRSRSYRILAFGASLLIVAVLLALFSTMFFVPDYTQAYPAPSSETVLVTPYPGPYPGPSEQLPLPPVEPYDLSMLEYSTFMPIVRTPLYIHLSIGGAFNGGNQRLVTEVISPQFAIDAYHWNKLPNQSQIQIIRSCQAYRLTFNTGTESVYMPFYNTGALNQVCWEPFSQQLRQVTATAYMNFSGTLLIDCPYQSCLIDTGVEPLFKSWAGADPEQIWLIGNEPDLMGQDALLDDFQAFDYETIDLDGCPTSTECTQDWGIITETLPISGPATYAAFFADIYRLVQEGIGPDHTPKLVFCQSASPDRNPGGGGLDYCEMAFESLPKALVADGQTISVDAAIYALSTHHYLGGQQILNGAIYTNGQLLDIDLLPQAFQEVWVERLQVFEQWAVDVGLGDKPLWLTEFGSGTARCHEIHAPADGVAYEEGGLPCVGKWKNNVFYGRNSHEGLWGLQTLQINYLNQPDNNWEAAWWFVSRMGKGPKGYCKHTGWIWGDNYNCKTNGNALSRAGETLRQTANCYLGNDLTACPQPGGSGITECKEESESCEEPEI